VPSSALTWGPLVLITGSFFGLFAIFTVRTALWGSPHHPRVQGVGSPIVAQFLLEYFYWLQGPVGPLAIRLGLHPDLFSWASLALQLVAAGALSQGSLALAGWVMWIGAACDALDGTVARATGLASEAGEVLDAVIDRWAEMALCFGLAWYYREWAPGFTVALWACAASVMVSYTRAKGEALNIELPRGLMNRHERAVCLIAATITSAVLGRFQPRLDTLRHWPLVVALASIGTLGTFSAIRRTRFLRVRLRELEVRS
jgi:CDP-diacylglycerol--glycerol-3-phosphate 3-phosphatidyltransferase